MAVLLPGLDGGVAVGDGPEGAQGEDGERKGGEDGDEGEGCEEEELGERVGA